MMKPKLVNRSFGFSLIEMLIAMSVGLVVLGGAVSMYTSGVQATWAVSQRAQMQQDSRAAFDLITQDISLAGAGLPTGGVALASGAVIPKYGCDVISGLCHLGINNNTALTFPPQSGAPTINQMYWVIPGCQQGPAINASIGATDTITVAYSDSRLLMPNYTVEFMDVNGNSINFIYPSPAPTPAPQQLNNTGVGLQAGDLVLFQYGTNYAIADVTTAPGTASSSPYAVVFANSDTLQFNQNAATSNGLKQLIAACTAAAVCTVGTPPIAANQALVTATRIWAVTYYLDKTSGVSTLMRQVNARQPVPLADNVQNLQFTYDTYNAAGTLLTASCSAGGTTNYNLIRTINLAHLSFRSQMSGTKGYQGSDMQGSVSARNLSFSARYGSN
jgi:prepilin-type N-terminal cleavage/methylation domain-containing protein